MNTNQEICKPRHRSTNLRRSNRSYQHTPRVNVYKNDKGYQIEMAIPGIKKEDVSISLEKFVLTIKHTQPAGDDQQYLNKGFDLNGFSRSFKLGTDLSVDQIEASFNAGILSVSLPLNEQSKPRTISIH